MKKKLPPTKFLDTVDEHEKTTAGRSPERSRQALLAQPREVAGLTIHPPTLVTQILLEEINHPILQVAQAKTAEEAAAIEVGARDVLHLIFICAQPEEAYRCIGLSRENFFASARDFGFRIPPSALAEIMPVIRDMLFQSTRTIPAVPGATPEGSAADPLAPSPRPARG